METTRKQNLTGMLAALAGYSMFGLTFVFTKHILSAGMSMYALLAWRLIIASALLLLLSLVGIFPLRLRGKKLWKLLPVGLCEPCLYFICESYGIARTTAAESGTIIAIVPICVLMLSRLIFKERQTRSQMLGAVLSVAGVICMVAAKGMDASFSLSGYLFLFGAVILAGIYHITVRWAGNEFTSAEMTFGTNVMGLVFFTALALGEGLIKGDLAATWIAPLSQPLVLPYVLLLAVGASVGAFMLVIYAINQIGPTRSSIFAGLTTTTSIVFGMLLLSERMLPWQLVGAVMTITGVWAANYFVPATPPPEAATETVEA